MMSLVLILALVSAQTAPTGTWATRTDGAFPFATAGSASDSRYAYFIGSGYAFGNNCYRFDATTGTWDAFPSPIPPSLNYGILTDNCCAIAQGKLYSFGDYSEEGAIFEYDLALGLSGTWTRLGPTVATGHRGACASDGDRIYVLGGFLGGTVPQNSLSIFDPTGPSVTQGASMPAARNDLMAAFLPSTGKLYAMGGGSAWQYGGNLQSTCFEYDPALDAWTTKTGFGAFGARSGAATMVLRNRIYLVGGWPATTNRQTLEYSPGADQWTRRADVTVGRQGAGGVEISGQGFVYGTVAGTSRMSLEEYTAPDFGQPPDAAANVRQVGPNGVLVQAGLTTPDDPLAWTTDQVEFTAEVTDPDAGQLVRLEVQVKPSGAPGWSGVPVQATPLSPQGTLSLQVTLPAEGDYDWRYRVADSLDNFTPMHANGAPGWTEFGAAGVTPDFRSDQAGPSAVALVSPAMDQDVAVPSPGQGPVHFTWTPAIDNGPASQITYELEVARDSSFGDVLHHSAGIPADPTSIAAVLPVSRFPVYWRVRARDLAGLLGPWSTPGSFRVVHDDGVNHGGGDASRVCGFGAGASPAAAAWVLAVLVAAGLIRIR